MNELSPLAPVWPARSAMEHGNHDMGDLMANNFEHHVAAIGQKYW